jgi:uncharacterized membrane protein
MNLQQIRTFIELYKFNGQAVLLALIFLGNFLITLFNAGFFLALIQFIMFVIMAFLCRTARIWKDETVSH